MKTKTIIAGFEWGADKYSFSWEMYWADGSYMGPQAEVAKNLSRIHSPGWDTMGWFAILLRF